MFFIIFKQRARLIVIYIIIIIIIINIYIIRASVQLFITQYNQHYTGTSSQTQTYITLHINLYINTHNIRLHSKGMKTQKLKFRHKKKVKVSTEPQQNSKPDLKLGNVQPEKIVYLLKQNMDTEQAKNQLRKISQDLYKQTLINQQDQRALWEDVHMDLPHWQHSLTDKNKTNYANLKTYNKQSHTPYSVPLCVDTNQYYSQAQMRARNQIKLINRHEHIERNIFQKKQQFFNTRKRNLLQTENLIKPQFQYLKNKTEKRLTKNKSIGDIPQILHDRNQKLAYLQSNIFQQFNKNKQIPRAVTGQKDKKHPRVILITPQIRVNPKTQQSQITYIQKPISTIQIKMPEFKSKKIKTKKAYTMHTEPQQNTHSIVTLTSPPKFFNTIINLNPNVKSNDSESKINAKNKSCSKLQNNNLYLQKTKTICVLQKPCQQSNKYISLSNYSNGNVIHASGNINSKSKMNRIVSISELMKKNRIKNKTITQFANNQQKQRMNYKTKQQKAAIQHTKDDIQFQTHTNLINTQMETKNAKTMFLRSQFERLKRLLNKQMKPQFKVDHESPIKIKKF